MRQELARLQVALLEGATAHAFGTALRTIKRGRALIEREFGVRYSEVHVAPARAVGLLQPEADRRALERDEAAIEHWKMHTWPRLKKSPPRAKTDRLRRRIGASRAKAGRDLPVLALDLLTVAAQD